MLALNQGSGASLQVIHPHQEVGFQKDFLRVLTQHCTSLLWHRVLEEHEEDLTSAIQTGLLDGEGEGAMLVFQPQSSGHDLQPLP